LQGIWDFRPLFVSLTGLRPAVSGAQGVPEKLSLSSGAHLCQLLSKYPTFDHETGDLVRESHQPELRRALEEGVWSDGEPMLGAFTSGAPVQQPDRVRIRAWAQVAGQFTVTDPRCVDALSPFCVWTSDYAERRLGWRRHQPLHVLLLRTHRIPRPVTVRVRDEYNASHPWVELQRDLPFEGTPVLSDAEFERASEEIRAITSEAGQPVLA